jgi:arylsulfatase A-like enzyme
MITSKKLRLLLYVFLCLFFLGTQNLKLNAQSKKPNIVLILGDDIGFKTLDIDEGKTYSTPNLDALAQHGMNFTECHSTPLCSPSRFILLTGKYNFRNYINWVVWIFPNPT